MNTNFLSMILKEIECLQFVRLLTDLDEQIILSLIYQDYYYSIYWFDYPMSVRLDLLEFVTPFKQFTRNLFV